MEDMVSVLEAAAAEPQAEGHAGFFFEGGAGTAHGQHKQVDGPEDGDGPKDSVADGVTLAEDASVAGDVVARDGDNARVNGDDGVGLNDHAVEAELHPTFADEVTWTRSREASMTMRRRIRKRSARMCGRCCLWMEWMWWGIS